MDSSLTSFLLLELESSRLCVEARESSHVINCAFDRSIDDLIGSLQDQGNLIGVGYSPTGDCSFPRPLIIVSCFILMRILATFVCNLLSYIRVWNFVSRGFASIGLATLYMYGYFT